MNHGGPQQGDRKPDFPQRLFQQRALGQQVLVRRIRADGRQADDLAGTGLGQSRRHGRDDTPGLGKAGLRVELGGRQDEDARCTVEG
jgi:hypothetical protein